MGKLKRCDSQDFSQVSDAEVSDLLEGMRAEAIPKEGSG
jgi:hypothetical protein